MPTFCYKILPEYVSGFGRLSLSGMIRLLQRAATDHTDRLGYTSRWYERNGTAWMARQHRLSIDAFPGPGEYVEIETEVEDFRRVRSLRGYTLRSDASGDILAEAHTDWVYLHRTEHSPRRIPDDMIEQFDPVYNDESPNRNRFESPEVPDDAFSKPFTVQFRDLDELAHVNNAVYTDYLLETLLGHLTGQSSNIPETGGVSNLTIQYVGQTNWKDRITCRLNFVESPGPDHPFSFIIGKEDGNVVEGRGTWSDSTTQATP